MRTPSGGRESCSGRTCGNTVSAIRSVIGCGGTATGGLLIVPDATIIAHRELVIALAARNRLPAVHPWRYFVTAGASRRTELTTSTYFKRQRRGQLRTTKTS